MEFERGLFHIYDRCLDSVEIDTLGTANAARTNTCKFGEKITLFFAFVSMLTLVILHVSFVGQAGCLVDLLNNNPQFKEKHANYTSNTSLLGLTQSSSIFQLGSEQVLHIKIRNEVFHDVLEGVDNAGRASNYNNNYDNTQAGNSAPRHTRRRARGLSYGGNGGVKGVKHVHHNHSTSSSNSVSDDDWYEVPLSSYDDSTPYDYAFCPSVTLLSLSDTLLRDRHFEVLNVTMEGTKCFGPVILQQLVAFGGMDTVVLNALMASTRQGGGLRSSASDTYIWQADDTDTTLFRRSLPAWRSLCAHTSESDHPHHHKDSGTQTYAHSATLIERYAIISALVVFDLAAFVSDRVWILARSIGAFFYLSTMTALAVRVLLSSAVLLIFPVCFGLRLLGCAIPTRVVYLAYPWLGGPLALFSLQGRSTAPFYIGHFTKCVLYLALFQAGQAYASSLFYDQRGPGTREQLLFAVMMMIEYFSLVYLRSSLGIQWFPRVALALVLCYHFYLYAHPAGFHMPALLTTFLLLFYSMIYTVRKYELPAYMRGEISETTPRSVYSTLPYASWDTTLSPDLTIFMPINARAASVYTEPVPTMPTTVMMNNLTTPPPPPAGGADGDTPQRTEATETDPLLPSGTINGSSTASPSAGGNVNISPSSMEMSRIV